MPMAFAQLPRSAYRLFPRSCPPAHDVGARLSASQASCLCCMILPVSATPKPSETYLNLRKQALGFKREEIGLPAPAQSTEPWGVIMDWPVGNGTATVVAISDGTASIYLSSGGG